MTTAAAIRAAYPRSAPVATAVVALARTLGVDPAWIANVIQFESGWNTQAVNRVSNATGLIQFMPKTAKGLGTSTAALKQMSYPQQFRYVATYFKPYAGRLHSQADVYLAVFYPAYIGKPANTAFPSRVTRSNPGIRTPADYARMANRRAKLPTGGGGGRPSPSGHPLSLPSSRRRSPPFRKSPAQRAIAKRQKRRRKRAQLILTVGSVTLALIMVAALAVATRSSS